MSNTRQPPKEILDDMRRAAEELRGGTTFRDERGMKAAVKSTEVFHRHAGQDWPSAEDCEVCFLQRQIRDQDKRVCDQADKIRNLEEQLAHYKEMYRTLREVSIAEQFPLTTLPDCMVPDGDSACPGYLKLREKAEMMATALHRIGEVTLVPGNWSVTDWPSLNGMVAAVRQMQETEVRYAKFLASLREISKCMEQLAEKRPGDWDVKGYAMALAGILMEDKT